MGFCQKCKASMSGEGTCKSCMPKCEECPAFQTVCEYWEKHENLCSIFQEKLNKHWILRDKIELKPCKCGMLPMVYVACIVPNCDEDTITCENIEGVVDVWNNGCYCSDCLAKKGEVK